MALSQLLCPLLITGIRKLGFYGLKHHIFPRSSEDFKANILVSTSWWEVASWWEVGPKASDEADGNTGRPQPGFFRMHRPVHFSLVAGSLTLERSKDRLSLVYPLDLAPLTTLRSIPRLGHSG